MKTLNELIDSSKDLSHGGRMLFLSQETATALHEYRDRYQDSAYAALAGELENNLVWALDRIHDLQDKLNTLERKHYEIIEEVRSIAEDEA